MAKKKKPSMAFALPELPEDIQRKILLSLPPKAFARSSVLSKSWLSFYNSTRRSFDITFKDDDKYRVPEELKQEIMDFDKSFSASLLREKLTVEEFNIEMSPSIYYLDDELVDLVCKWLAALFTTNNIVKVLRIQIWAIGKFSMPPEIFFNESLQVLHLETNCILDGVYPRNLGCLRVLSLYNIFMDDESTNGLLTACPILEQLTWLNDDFGGQHIIIKGLHKLKDLTIRGLHDIRIQEAPALEKVYIIQHEIDDQTVIDSQVCRRIKLLNMSVYSERTAMHIQEIVSCLPALEQLTLSMDTDIIISSHCLKHLKLYVSEFNRDPKMVKINAPNLRCYDYETDSPKFSRHLTMKTGMLEMVLIDLSIKIDEPRHMLELRKALQMIEHLKLGVDIVQVIGERVCVKASTLDQNLNVSATRVIEMLDAGAVKFIDSS